MIIDTEADRLWRRRDSDPQARERLIEAHRYLVFKSVDRVVPNVPHRIDREDLISEGLIALVKAVDAYDYRRGVKFTTYAITRIRGSFLEWLRREDHVPRSIRKKQRRVVLATAKIEQQGEHVTESRLLEELGITREEWLQLGSELAGIDLISLDVLNDFEDDAPPKLMDRLSYTQPNLEEQVVSVEYVRQALAQVTGRRGKILNAIIMRGVTQRSLQAELGCSESRMHQLKAEAVVTVREWMEETER